jgi:hypothetical protein
MKYQKGSGLNTIGELLVKYKFYHAELFLQQYCDFLRYPKTRRKKIICRKGKSIQSKCNIWNNVNKKRLENKIGRFSKKARIKLINSKLKKNQVILKMEEK